MSWDWPRPKANGILGLWYPWLISEILHYGYAVVMLIGIWVLRKGFSGVLPHLVDSRARHPVLASHRALSADLASDDPSQFLGKPVPCSVLQLLFPRVELHLFYNGVIFVPMVIAMYYHMFPPESDREKMACTCEWSHKEWMHSA